MDRAREAVEARAASRPQNIPELPLMDFIPWASPTLVAPKPLAPLVEILEDGIVRGGRRDTAHAPVRHGKTVLLEHAVCWALSRDPTTRIIYVTYGQQRAYSVSDNVRELARRIGIPLRQDRQGVSLWRTPAGGQFLPTYINGPGTGEGANIIFIDDPFKDRIEAESAGRREKVYSWIKGTAFNRAEPNAFIMVMMARWHGDDFTGRLIDPEGDHCWPYTCLPAIDAQGAALWPERWPISELEIKRKDEGEYNWASLYQGDPTPSEGLLFHNARMTRTVPQPKPDVRVTYAIGVDLTWTSKQSSDYSALVVMARVDIRYPEKRSYYVIVDAFELQRRATAVRDEAGKVVTPGFASFIRERMETWKTNRVATHAGNAEQALLRTIRDLPSDERVSIRAYPARGKKIIRSQRYAATWNAGEVLVRKGQKWTRSLVLEHVSFTGEENAKDNFVDAATSAHHALNVGHGGAV